MNFLKEIRAHIANFGSEASSELHRFVDYLESKYKAPEPAVVQPVVTTMPAPENPAPTSVTISAPAAPAAAASITITTPATTCAPTEVPAAEGEENGN